MKRNVLSLVLVLAVCLGLAVPAGAVGDIGTAGAGTTISAGDGFQGVIDEKGTLWMWGYNCFGQLGNGGGGDTTYYSTAHYFSREEDRTRPCQTTPVQVLEDVVSVSCGRYHAAAVKADGSLWTWGLNYAGQLGNGGEGNAVYEQPLPAPPGTKPATIPHPYQTVPTKVMDGIAAVSCGETHTAAVGTDGSLWIWGDNDHGQLGNGRSGNVGSRVGPLEEFSNVPIKVMEDVSSVSCGAYATAALKRDGSLWMWGDNAGGCLGLGSRGGVETSPRKIMDGVAAVSCGQDITMIVKTDGTVWSCGTGTLMGELGTGASGGRSDRFVSIGTNASSCDAFGAYVEKSGRLFTWGNNTYGALGLPYRGERLVSPNVGFLGYYMALPSLVEGISDVAAVSRGSSNSLAVKTDGTVWVWGDNEEGQLGNGGQSDQKDAFGIRDIQSVPSQIRSLRAKLPGSAGPSAGTTAPVYSRAFSDVPPTAYYADAVMWAVDRKITSGTSKTTFSPDRTCTTAEILTFLWRAKGEPMPGLANENFFDNVDFSDYYAAAAMWAKEHGLVSGNIFHADTPCDRASVVTYLWKLSGSPAPSSQAGFTDVPADAAYAQAVAWAVEQKITSGTGKTTFSPSATCTRGQIVTFLYRALGQ